MCIVNCSLPSLPNEYHDAISEHDYDTGGFPAATERRVHQERAGSDSDGDAA